MQNGLKRMFFYERKNILGSKGNILGDNFQVFNGYPFKNVTKYFAHYILHIFPFQNILHLFLFVRKNTPLLFTD